MPNTSIAARLQPYAIRVLPVLAIAAVIALSFFINGKVHLNGRLVACAGSGYGYGYVGGPPSVTGVDPAIGLITPGTTVTITGQGFCNSTSAVNFNSASSPSFTVNSDTSITAISPAHALGITDVTVVNTAGTSATSQADKFAFMRSGLYTNDGFGFVDPADSAFVDLSVVWPGWNIAGPAHAWPGTGAGASQQGFVLDYWGGLHPYGVSGLSETSGASGHYWPGWNIARDFAFMPDGSGGVVLDGWGGLHAFGVNGSAAPTVSGFTYWPGWDIARKVVIFADGSGGFTMDAWGGLHPFSLNGGTVPAASAINQTGAYWPGWNAARDVKLISGNGGHSGYILDFWGGIHPFFVTSDTGATMPAAITAPAYWPGWDIARGIFFAPGSNSAGWTLDGWGGLHAFGGAPDLNFFAYDPGHDIFKAVFGE
jgi:IPT/TIG domain